MYTSNMTVIVFYEVMIMPMYRRVLVRGGVAYTRGGETGLFSSFFKKKLV